MRDKAARDALPPRVRQLLDQVLALLTPELNRELERVLVALEQDVYGQAELARNPALQSGYMDTLRKLRLHRDRFAPTFLGGLETLLMGIRSPARPDDDALDTPVYDSLRLVDHNEISEEAVLSTIALRHESRAGLPLLLLGQRFGVLAGAPAFDAASLPVGPQAFGRLLAEAGAVLELNLETRLQLYQLYDRQLMPGYAPWVEAINALLDSANVLPELTFVPLRRRRATPDSDAAQDRRSTSPDAPAEGAAGQPRNYTAWPGEADRSAHGSAEEAEMLALLRELLAQRRAATDSTGEAAPPSTGTAGRPRTALASAEIDAALGALQTRAPTPQSPRSVPDIRQALLAQSRLQRGHATTLSGEDNDTFELLNLLYTAIGSELRKGAPSNDLLDRLQVPLLRVALQDRGFFVREEHPARQLLNAVAEAGAVWIADDETDPQLNSKLQHAVDHVVTHYDGDATVFDSANQKLQQHLQAMARKAEVSERRHVDAARGRDKLDLAKARANEAIDQAVGGGTLPKFLRTLLDQAWTDVLTLVLLRHGEDSGEWRLHATATAQIVATHLLGEPAPDGLAARIESALGLVGYHGEEAVAIARQLTGVPDDNDDPASRTELAIKLKARTRLGADAEPKPAEPEPRTPREQECYELLRALPFGTWIEFSTNQQGDMVRRRLAWFSPTTGRALFVNQRGQRVDDNVAHDLDQVARLLAIGQARVVSADRGRLVDRAWQASLSALRGLTGRDRKQEESA
ncbi:DUF1631 domain-containing protein [Novilysobacter erysipheiresistens]